MPSWPLATLAFPIGYLPLLVTDSRLLRPGLPPAVAALLFARWSRALPAGRTAALAAAFLVCFVLSHLVAAVTVPAVGVVVAGAVFGAAAWALADRPARWGPAPT